MLVEMLRGHLFQRREFVDACVVHQHVHFSVSALRLLEQPLHAFLLRHVALHGDCFPACCRDPLHYFLRRGPTVCIIHHHRGAFRGQMFGNGSPDSLRSSRDDGYFSCELAHDDCSFLEILRIGPVPPATPILLRPSCRAQTPAAPRLPVVRLLLRIAAFDTAG
jgi:hypothetical protein